MRRWRAELPIMLRRWRLELRQHGYDWGDYVGPYLAGVTIWAWSCHCEKGPGHYRKKRPLQHHHSCDLCHYGKDIGMFGGHGRFAGNGYRFRQNREYRFLKEEFAAHEPVSYRSRKRKVLPYRVSSALEDAMQPYTHSWERLPDGNMRMVRNPKLYVWPREFVEIIRQDEIRRGGGSETPSLKRIHRIREQEYQKTKGLPLEKWLRPADAEKVAWSFRRLGLKVRIITRKQQARPRG